MSASCVPGRYPERKADFDRAFAKWCKRRGLDEQDWGSYRQPKTEKEKRSQARARWVRFRDKKRAEKQEKAGLTQDEARAGAVAGGSLES